MAVAANALTTVAQCKTELGIGDTTYDTVLERLVNVASDAIEQLCDRSFYKTTVTAEAVKGFGGYRILLARTPLVSITSITYLGETLSTSSYAIENAEAGTVYRDAGWRWTAQYRQGVAIPDLEAATEQALYLVTYVGGYVTPAQGGSRTLPYDVEQAAIDTVVNLFRDRGKYQRMTEETEPENEEGWPGKVIPARAMALLKSYRRAS